MVGRPWNPRLQRSVSSVARSGHRWGRPKYRRVFWAGRRPLLPNAVALRSAAGLPCIGVADETAKDIVRRGYDAASRRYDQAYGGATKYQPWLAELPERLPQAADILDLGCGSGLPVARDLTALGYRVTGVDISDVQIQRAIDLVPDATFIRADVSTVRFDPASFDAVVSFFALIHLPLADQPVLLERVASWLRPAGLLVATTGYWAWTGYEENWLGGGAAMWWSHADVTTYRSWITQAGLSIDREDFVPESDSGHALFWSHKPSVPAPTG